MNRKRKVRTLALGVGVACLELSQGWTSEQKEERFFEPGAAYILNMSCDEMYLKRKYTEYVQDQFEKGNLEGVMALVNWSMNWNMGYVLPFQTAGQDEYVTQVLKGLTDVLKKRNVNLSEISVGSMGIFNGHQKTRELLSKFIESGCKLFEYLIDRKEVAESQTLKTFSCPTERKPVSSVYPFTTEFIKQCINNRCPIQTIYIEPDLFSLMREQTHMKNEEIEEACEGFLSNKTTLPEKWQSLSRALYETNLQKNTEKTKLRLQEKQNKMSLKRAS